SLRRRGPHHPADGADRACGHRRARRLRRPRQHLRDLGSFRPRRLQGRGASARAGEGPHLAAPRGGCMSAPRHRPVLLAEVLQLLAPRDGGIYVDGTFGAGGYSRAILESADCRVVGIDRDPRAIADGATLARSFAGRLTLIEGRFGEMTDLLAAEGVTAADGVALDLGVSSMQLDQGERGFSFRADGPLDMRMGREGPSAADLVNSLPETERAAILFRYGEEKRSRAIARAIIRRRGEAPITRTGELAAVVHSVTGPKRQGGRGQSAIDPATRSFQALRIAVNDELGEL